MNLDWHKIVKDKRLWLGVAGAAAVGAVVFVRRNGIAPATSAPTGGGAPGTIPVGTSGYVQGGADTTGSDLASFLGDWGKSQNSALQESLDAYNKQLTDTLTSINNGAGGGQTTPRDHHHGQNGSGYDTIQVNAGQWVRDVLPANLSYEQLRSLNPGLDIFGQADAQGYISPSNPADPGTLQNVFTRGGSVKIPKLR